MINSSIRLITDQQILEICQTIVEQFQPEKIILFGSYAYGQPDEWSDIDLLVVMNFKGRAMHLAMQLWQATKPELSVDFVVKSPNEIQWRYQQFDPLVRMAIDRGKVLYDASYPGMD